MFQQKNRKLGGQKKDRPLRLQCTACYLISHQNKRPCSVASWELLSCQCLSSLLIKIDLHLYCFVVLVVGDVRSLVSALS